MFQPRFREWHLDKGDIEKSAMMHGFVDELEKLALIAPAKKPSPTAAAPKRALWKDFMAGVDPTGTKTSVYGVKDVPASTGQRALRQGVGTVGGLLGGALVVPSVVYYIIEGAAAAPGGGSWKQRLARIGAAAGRGFLKPIREPLRAHRAANVMQKVQQGGRVVARDVGTMRRFAQLNLMSGVIPGLASGKATPQQLQRAMEFMKSTGKLDPALKSTQTEVSKGLAAIGLSGLIGGGSAALQYHKGGQTGNIMTDRQRAKL